MSSDWTNSQYNLLQDLLSDYFGVDFIQAAPKVSKGLEVPYIFDVMSVFLGYSMFGRVIIGRDMIYLKSEDSVFTLEDTVYTGVPYAKMQILIKNMWE